jgi:hypothetical protein
LGGIDAKLAGGKYPLVAEEISEDFTALRRQILK